MRTVLVISLLAGCGRFGFDDSTSDATDVTGPRIVDAALGAAHTCVLDDQGRVKCWGFNEWGILGQGRMDDQLRDPAAIPSVDLGTSSVMAIESLADYTCAVTDEGIKCWGNNDGYQLGRGDNFNIGDDPNEMGEALIAVPLTSSVLTVGHYHSCVLNDDGVRCWGLNELGQLGRENSQSIATTNELSSLAPIDLGRFTPVEIESQFNATCARDLEGRVKCWGQNLAGGLGVGSLDTLGDNAGEMGDNLPLLELGTGVTASKLGGGQQHGCAITNVGLKCWGKNDNGELGQGDTDDRGDQDSDMGDALLPIDLGGTVTEVVGGFAFTCALIDGEVTCWGDGADGVLCSGDTEDRGTLPGQLGPRIPLPAPATQIFAGGGHACAILTTGELACWGSNNMGQLGTSIDGAIGNEPGEIPFIHSVSTVWP